MLANFYKTSLHFSQSWRRLESELNVLSFINSLESGYFLSHFLVGHLYEVNFTQSLILGGNPSSGLLFLFSFILFCIGFRLFNDAINRFLKELHLFETGTDISFECYQVFCKFLMRNYSHKLIH